MYYSYVMGVDNSINDLKAQGFIVENDRNNYMVTFPNEKAFMWEEFIAKHLEVGYWNEYLAEDCVIFLFHLQDGIKRYEVNSFDNDKVLKLCEKLCNCRFVSLRSMLASNHFYKPIIDRYI